MTKSVTTAKPNDTSTVKRKKNDFVLWITYLNIILYALSYQLQKPVEPYLIQSLTEQEQKQQHGDIGENNNDTTIRQNYGNLQSFFSFCQFFGSPLVGILLDRIGIRNTSCIVFLASALSYAILSYATNLYWVFLSKVPTIFQAAFLVAQATAATTTGGDTSLRAAALGRMTTAYTLGATIGPALGGYLATSGDFYLGAKLAVVGSLISAILSFFFLPNSIASSKGGLVDPEGSRMANNNSTNNVQKTDSFLDNLQRSKDIAVRPNIWPLLAVKALGGVCASMHSTAFPLVLTQSLHFNPQQLGLAMSVSMFAVAAFGAFAMAPLTKALGSFGMMNAGLISRCIIGLVMALFVSIATNTVGTASSDATLKAVIAVSVLYSLSQHILATGLTTQTTGSVDKQEQGTLLGLEHSLFSLARIGGPALGTALLGIGAGGLWSVETVCGSFDIFLAISLSLALPQPTKREKKQ